MSVKDEVTLLLVRPDAADGEVEISKIVLLLKIACFSKL